MHPKTIIRFFSLLLALLMLSLPVMAEGEDEPEGLLDPAELDEQLAPLLERYGATEVNFGLAFTYTATGETYMIHPDAEFYGASLYKLPLCMTYAERVGKGELTYDSIIKYAPLSSLMESTLVYSKNDTAATLFFSSDAPYDDDYLNAYTDLEPEELPQFFKDFYFTPRFMHQTLTTLYNEPERFPGILDYMKQASPNNFFRKNLEGKYEIAQKYGEFEGVLHTAGIIYTPTPVILVVMCYRMPYQLEAIEELSSFFADYSLTLDQRQAAREAEAAEAEAALLQEEEAAARRAEEEKAAAEAAREQEQQLRRREEERAALSISRRNTVILLGGAVLVALTCLVLLQKLNVKGSSRTKKS